MPLPTYEITGSIWRCRIRILQFKTSLGGSGDVWMFNQDAGITVRLLIVVRHSIAGIGLKSSIIHPGQSDD